MLPDRVSNPVPLTYESGALPIALRCPAQRNRCPGKATVKSPSLSMAPKGRASNTQPTKSLAISKR